jgi:hypothetical protein
VKKLNNLPWASEYWRASMSPGDRLVLDYGATNQLGVGVCVLSPDVTDYTEQGASCLSSAITSAQTEMRFTAPVRGGYTIRFAVNACACTDPLSYQFVARLVAPTRVILHSPKLVRRGAHIHVSGVVTGGAAGNVALRLSGPLHARKIVRIQSGGRFVSTFSLRAAGRYTLIAIFYGNPSHAQSSRSVHITAR